MQQRQEDLAAKAARLPAELEAGAADAVQVAVRMPDGKRISHRWVLGRCKKFAMTAFDPACFMPGQHPCTSVAASILHRQDRQVAFLSSDSACM